MGREKGIKRGKQSRSGWKSKVSKTELNSVNPNSNSSEQKRRQNEQRGSTHPNSDQEANQNTRKVTAQFLEDDQVVEMEADGQQTEFCSEAEDDSQTLQTEPELSDEEDGEIFFNSQENNNAVIATSNVDVSKDLEEGECDGEDTRLACLNSTESVTGKSGIQPSMSKLIDEKIRQSISQVREYFDEKFNNLTKVMELEKQLEWNKKKLEELKE